MIGLAVAVALSWTGAGSVFATSVLQLEAGGIAASVAATGFNALASQASVSLINNKGDIGKTFEDLASSDSMRSIVVAMLATGADKGASAALGTQTAQAVKDSALSYAVKFADHLKNQLISNTIHASLSSALEGGEWDRKLLEGVQGAVIGATAATGANFLGDSYKDAKGALHENFLGHKAAHAALGALTAELSGKDAASGAIGAALGEVVGEIQAEKLQERIKTGELKPEDLNVEIQKAVVLSRFVGGATAFAMGGDVLMAAQAAGNAAEENSLKLFLNLLKGGGEVLKKIKKSKILKNILNKKDNLNQNPFKNKTPEQIDKMLKKKGFEPKGPNPIEGKGGYVNPRTTRSYHIDEKNRFNEPPHVDINRSKNYGGNLPKKKIDL